MTGWLMQDGDPQRSRRVAAGGPRKGRLLWSLDLGEVPDEPVVLPDGTIHAPFSIWAKRAAIAVIDADGRLRHEVPPHRPEWSWRSPVARVDGRVHVFARDLLFELSPQGSATQCARLPGAPARALGAPDGGFCFHCGTTGFTSVGADGALRWSSASKQDSAWREGTFAFDLQGTLYTAEHDTWRSDGDDVEQFSRIGAHDRDGRRLWRRQLTAGSAYSWPENQVHRIWGRDGEAVFFGEPMIQCYAIDGSERWRIARPADLRRHVAIPGTQLRIGGDERIAAAPCVVRIDQGGMDYLSCAIDAEGNTYFCAESQVIALDPDYSVRWRIRLDEAHLRPPVLSPQGHLLVAAGSRIHAIE